MERQSSRNILDAVDPGLRRLCHPPPGIRGQRLQITAGPLRVQHAQSQRRLAGSRHTGDPHQLPQRNIQVYIF